MLQAGIHGLVMMGSVGENTTLDLAEKKELLKQLTEADGFEIFAQTKYTGVKRFGAEGGESIVPALDAIITQSAKQGVEEVAVGMAHRGRLNILTNVLGQYFTYLFSIFAGGATGLWVLFRFARQDVVRSGRINAQETQYLHGASFLAILAQRRNGSFLLFEASVHRS